MTVNKLVNNTSLRYYDNQLKDYIQVELLQADYDSLATKKPYTVYRCTDTHKIYVNGIEYGKVGSNYCVTVDCTSSMEVTLTNEQITQLQHNTCILVVKIQLNIEEGVKFYTLDIASRNNDKIRYFMIQNEIESGSLSNEQMMVDIDLTARTLKCYVGTSDLQPTPLYTADVAQTVKGVKTFTMAPLTDGSVLTNNNLATKKYVDDGRGSISNPMTYRGVTLFAELPVAEQEGGDYYKLLDTEEPYQGQSAIWNPTTLQWDISTAELPTDSALSTTSVNPVENGIITNALNTKMNLTGNETVEGKKTFSGNTVINGTTTLKNTTINGTLDVSSATTCNSTVTATDTVTATTFMGTRTQSVLCRNNYTEELDCCGGTSITNGSHIQLFGKSNNSGKFDLTAYKTATNYATLEGKTDGTLTWCGKKLGLKHITVTGTTGGTFEGCVMKFENLGIYALGASDVRWGETGERWTVHPVMWQVKGDPTGALTEVYIFDRSTSGHYCKTFIADLYGIEV